jgi:phosphate transport system permease protein
MAAIVLAFFGFLVLDVVVHGVPELSPGYFFERTTDNGKGGGIGPVLASTLLISLLGTLLSLPLAIGGAVACSELLQRRPRWSRLVRRCMEVVVSAPSVAVGLIGWTLFSTAFGLGFSLVSGALTLALMLAPLMGVAFLAGIEAVPKGLRSQSMALGVSRWTTFWSLVVPAARPALLAGLMLAVGRATAETAALILTSGISTRMPQDLFDPGATLAVHVYHLARNVPGGEPRAYAAALALILVNVLVHFALSRLRPQEVTP